MNFCVADGGFANGKPEPQIIINGRFPLDESETLRLKVLAVIKANDAALSAADRQRTEELRRQTEPPMWK